MKTTLFLSVVSALLINCGATQAQTKMEFKLYPVAEPQSNGLDHAAYAATGKGPEALEPMLYVHLPEGAQAPTGAVVICPGGGYSRTAMDHEGHQVAQWLNELGIAGVVVRYRMPNGHYEIPLADAQRALKIVRDSASKWNINPAKVGVMGFSAGGHLASTVATHFTQAVERPDFSVLIYPVITMDTTYTHRGSHNQLIGADASSDLVARYSNEKRITPQTPPTFIALSDDDKTVVPRNSVEYYLSLKRAGVPAQMHIYASGGHGWGMRENFKYRNEFLTSLERWLTEQVKGGK